MTSPARLERLFSCEGPFRVVVRDWSDDSYFVLDDGMAKRARAAGFRTCCGSPVGRDGCGAPWVNCALWVVATRELSLGEVVCGRLSYDPSRKSIDETVLLGLPRLSVWCCLEGEK